MRDLQAVLGKLDYSSIVLATGFVVLFFNSGSRYAFGLMLKPMTDDLGWSRSELSLALAAFMLVSALAMPFAGRLADRYSIRTVLAAGGTGRRPGHRADGTGPVPLAALRRIRARLRPRTRRHGDTYGQRHDLAVVRPAPGSCEQRRRLGQRHRTARDHHRARLPPGLAGLEDLLRSAGSGQPGHRRATGAGSCQVTPAGVMLRPISQLR